MSFDKSILSNEVASILQPHQLLNVESHADRYCNILLKNPYSGQYGELCSMKVFNQLGVRAKLLDDLSGEKNFDFKLFIDKNSIGFAECYSIKRMSTEYIKKYDDVEYPNNASVYSQTSGKYHVNTKVLLSTQQIMKKILISNFDDRGGIIRMRVYETPTGNIAVDRIKNEICKVVNNLFLNSEKNTPTSYEHETYKDAKTGMSIGLNVVRKPEYDSLVFVLEDRNSFPPGQATSEALRMLKEKIKNKPFKIKKRNYLIVHSFDIMTTADVLESLYSREVDVWKEKYLDKCAGIIWITSSRDIFDHPFHIGYTDFFLNPNVDHHPKLKGLIPSSGS